MWVHWHRPVHQVKVDIVQTETLQAFVNGLLDTAVVGTYFVLAHSVFNVCKIHSHTPKLGCHKDVFTLDARLETFG